MLSIKPDFDLAASPGNIAWLIWIIAILDDAERSRKEAKAKAEQNLKAELLRKGTVPRPF